MRPIKFRAKTKDGDWFIWEIFSDIAMKELLEAIDEETLGQFTGLLDKNGKEIYEGDIVKQGCEAPFSDMHGEYTLKEVMFNNGAFILSYLTSATGNKLLRGYTAMFINDLEDVNNEHLLWSTEPLKIPVEVIGNIYENPELITLPSEPK